MKGLYYSYLVQKKSFLIGTAVTAVLVAALGCFLLLSAANENYEAGTRQLAGNTAGMIIYLTPIICAIIPGEGLNRDLEASLKCRFQNYILSGMTYVRFCNIELVKSLATQLIAAAAIGFCDLMFMIADSSAMSYEIFAAHIMLSLFGNVINWIAMPLTAVLKSQEKAGLILGVALAAFILPFMINMMKKYDGAIAPDFDWLGEPLTMVIAVAITAAIYAIGYLIFYKVMKRGDLC